MSDAHLYKLPIFSFAFFLSPTVITHNTLRHRRADMALFQVIVGALLAAATIASSFASFIDAIVFAAPLLATLLAPLLAALSAPRLRGFSIHLYQEGRMDALNVSTRRQLEDLLQQMVPLFEGDETEQNWLVREKAVKRLQRLAWGDAPHRFPKVYVAGLNAFLTGDLLIIRY